MRSLLLLAFRGLKRNPRRSAISLSTVALGVAALIVAGGFVDSLLIRLREDTIHSQLGHIQIQDPRYGEFGLSRPYAYLLDSDAARVAPIAALPGVKEVTPRLTVNGLVSVGETTLSFTGQGIEVASDSSLTSGIAIRAGRFLDPGEQDGVILGEGLADNLGVRPGDKVALLVTTASGSFNASDFTVRGTFASVSKAYDDIALRLPLSAAQRLLHVRGAQQWLVLLKDTSATGQIYGHIRDMLPRDRYALTRWDQFADFYEKTATLFGRQFGFVRFVIMAVIVLAILNIMTMTVLERTWEIGVMMALGDRRRRVLALFAIEGLLVAVAGAAGGALVGGAVAKAIDIIGVPMPAPPGMSHGFDAGVSLSWGLVAGAAALGAAASAIGAVPPAMRASRMAIVEALRRGH